ncbi:hypothetical protein [Rhizobium sp. J15]|uniref:hypothetical protein n=1 Tax=Rhizobium sp. J15 TaxID=2035450 RepID=UPI0011424591|nr:hypothetical protein [Rhizobium sp. J15]
MIDPFLEQNKNKLSVAHPFVYRLAAMSNFYFVAKGQPLRITAGQLAERYCQNQPDLQKAAQ